MTVLLLRVAVVGLAAYRLARAVALDSITEPLRMRVYTAAYGDEPVSDSTTPHRPASWLYGLLSCPYCCGFWIALGLYAGWVNLGWSRPLIVAVAAAGFAALLVGLDLAAAAVNRANRD